MQEDLDWMYAFLSAQAIESKRNYSVENEKGWNRILSMAGFQNIRSYTRQASFTYDTIDFWWNEMMDYNWPVEGENSDVITDSLKAAACHSVHGRLTETGGIPFRRDALIVTALRKDDKPSS